MASDENIKTQGELIAVPDPAGVGDPVWVTPEQYDSLVETAEVLDDPALREALAKSTTQKHGGQTRSWRSVKDQLGL